MANIIPSSTGGSLMTSASSVGPRALMAVAKVNTMATFIVEAVNFIKTIKDAYQSDKSSNDTAQELIKTASQFPISTTSESWAKFLGIEGSSPNISTNARGEIISKMVLNIMFIMGEDYGALLLDNLKNLPEVRQALRGAQKSMSAAEGDMLCAYVNRLRTAYESRTLSRFFTAAAIYLEDRADMMEELSKVGEDVWSNTDIIYLDRDHVKLAFEDNKFFFEDNPDPSDSTWYGKISDKIKSKLDEWSKDSSFSPDIQKSAKASEVRRLTQQAVFDISPISDIEVASQVHNTKNI